MICRHALAMTTGGNDSTFAFFLLGVPAPLPFFESLPPPVLDECMSGGGGGGPGVAGGASPSIPADPGGGGPGADAGGFALLFFFAVLAAGVALLMVPRGPILVCEGLGGSSGMMTTWVTSGGPV